MKAQRTLTDVWNKWLEYEKSCTDQSAVIHEFIKWYKLEPVAITKVSNRGQLRRLCEAGRLELDRTSRPRGRCPERR
jgi:hypothetical protein